MSSPSLLQRVKSKNAPPVSKLVEKGDKAAAELSSEFGGFLRERLLLLYRLSLQCGQSPDSPALQDEFLRGVMDIRSSAQTMGYAWPAKFAGLLEAVLMAAQTSVERARLVSVQMDALLLSAQEGVAPEELTLLEQKLTRLSA